MSIHHMLANICPGRRQHASPKSCIVHPSSENHVQMSLLCGRKEDSTCRLSPDLVAFPQSAFLELVRFTEFFWVEAKGRARQVRLPYGEV